MVIGRNRVFFLSDWNTFIDELQTTPRTMDTRFARFSKGMVTHRKRVHIAVFILTLFMIPGALTALQPIDMESYEMESPELTAQTIIDTEFPTSEIILGFVVSVRDPAEVENLSSWEPASTDN